MAFRFQKRIKLFKGVRLNLSKSGVSTSFGKRGAQITVGRQTRATVGIPGSGLSYTATTSAGNGKRRSTGGRARGGGGQGVGVVGAFLTTLILCWVWNIMTKYDVGIATSIAISSVVAYLVYKGKSAAAPPGNDQTPDE